MYDNVVESNNKRSEYIGRRTDGAAKGMVMAMAMVMAMVIIVCNESLWIR